VAVISYNCSAQSNPIQSNRIESKDYRKDFLSYVCSKLSTRLFPCSQSFVQYHMPYFDEANQYHSKISKESVVRYPQNVIYLMQKWQWEWESSRDETSQVEV
jgi:hypothetical protein